MLSCQCNLGSKQAELSENQNWYEYVENRLSITSGVSCWFDFRFFYRLFMCSGSILITLTFQYENFGSGVV